MWLHPDDALFFYEVASAMRRVAKSYQLPLRDIQPMPDPQAPCALGDCSADGLIRLVLRFREGNEWTAPRREEDVWGTAAHELAHLRHFDHKIGFQEFEQELLEAMTNQRQDHTKKVLDRLVKLQRQKESEAKIGNTAAAEAFASMINKMLIEYELNPTDIDYARVDAEDPVVEIPVQFELYGIKRKKSRIAWQETLAGIVARAHLCTFFLATGTNRIWFVGTRSHATVAEYVYGTLVPAADFMSDKESYFYKLKCYREGEPKKSHGFREAWMNAFIGRIRERFDEARKQAIAEAPKRDMSNVPGAESTALVRLGGAMKKVDDYVDGKFGKRRRYVAHLNGRWSSHEEGRAAGRAAADRIFSTRKALTSNSTKMIGDGKE